MLNAQAAKISKYIEGTYLLFGIIFIGLVFIFLNKDIDHLHKTYLASFIEVYEIILKVLIMSTTSWEDEDFLGGMVVLSVKKAAQNFSIQDTLLLVRTKLIF